MIAPDPARKIQEVKYMYAVIKTGGKQYKVSEGEKVRIEKLSYDVNSEVEFDEVLMVVNDGDVKVGKPFIEGAKEGFNVAVKIIPYLIAVLVAVGVFRASGAMTFLIQGIASLFAMIGLNTAFVDVLPVAFMKPLSGSGARGMMIDRKSVV